MAGLLFSLWMIILDDSLKGYAVSSSKVIIQVEVLKKMAADIFSSL
jgi:hypothetical protein